MKENSGLVLTLSTEELVKIGDDIWLQPFVGPRGQWRVRIIAPDDVKIDRIKTKDIYTHD